MPSGWGGGQGNPLANLFIILRACPFNIKIDHRATGRQAYVARGPGQLSPIARAYKNTKPVSTL